MFTESRIAETTQQTTISDKSSSLENDGKQACLWFIFCQWFSSMATAFCYLTTFTNLYM